MSLDPEIAALLPALNAGFPPVETLTGVQARVAIRERVQKPAHPEPVARVVDRHIPGPATDLKVRVYWPNIAGEAKPPIVVFAHGGGFVFCDIDSHDVLCRAMTNGIGAVVMSVDYRLAPESPWPAAAEDVYAAANWAAANGTELGADATRLVVAGDSAGGNLAAVAAIMARDRQAFEITCQALLYPVIAADFDTRSYREYGVGYYNTRAAMAWYWDQYVPAIGDRAHPYASPLAARLAGLPPAVVVTAGCDPLRSEGEAYADALEMHGVSVLHRKYPGAIHGFMTMPSLRLATVAQGQLWTDISTMLTGY